ncbi:hypothetical protein F53441_6213 [Fusarium austroafricanum]|uniref:Uncharacterized protein n=1 Tax=Fusarium austroafricanum TaxID=2364996 RepID=A0A8H4KHV4_9HYPO|nr:hypothetical protein F53441_6213 [Fusarium austroafricanum]
MNPDAGPCWTHVAPTCTFCFYHCEREQNGWICTDCRRPYRPGPEDIESEAQNGRVTSKEDSATSRDGVILHSPSGTQESSHQLPPSYFSNATATSEDKSPGGWGSGVSQSNHDLNSNDSTPAVPVSNVAMQGSCISTVKGSGVEGNTQGQEVTNPDEGCESMDLDNDDEDSKQEEMLYWISEGTRGTVPGRTSDVYKSLVRIISCGLDPNGSSHTDEAESTLDISDDDSDMEDQFKIC